MVVTRVALGGVVLVSTIMVIGSRNLDITPITMQVYMVLLFTDSWN